MVILAFVIYALHHFFIASWIEQAARWSSSTLAEMGHEHAAYYAGLGWAKSDFLYWLLYFLECGMVAYAIRKVSQSQLVEND